MVEYQLQQILSLIMLNDAPTSAMTVLSLTIKGQKVGGGPIPGNPHRFPKIIGIILPGRKY